MRQNGEYVSAVYVQLPDVELPADEDYQILLRGTVLADDFAVPEQRASAELALLTMASILSECPGIDVLNSDVVSEADFSLDDVRRVKRWDPLDPLSLSDDQLD